MIEESGFSDLIITGLSIENAPKSRFFHNLVKIIHFKFK
ncbi:hypothetical protein SMSP2_01223 [Limihaloglobus sulfuriphilus]|uniref:Uncharacterized protein n=1 Tax=Limihaloglobus sulfuriphilus TaxID=1851148 RepID=A0A1Q2MDT5_9BACT|nr:hypothetical protein SMSP2_01223 [Limihaloglobus sulfuriphilus]